MTARFWLKPCYGYSATKGGKVGERHRWSGDITGDGWGKGTCIWCHRSLEQLRYPAKVNPREGSDLLSWACGRWRDEVQGRPLVNVHRRTLDDTWRQVVRYAGGNPDDLLGPPHDELLAHRRSRT